jgi:REP element-mobilizing transposase RayT
MCRGDGREAIFLTDRDRETFIDTLRDVCDRTGWIVHAYVLMTNHYHLQLETPEANLVAGMKWFQGTYTQRFHARNNTCGHLFQGRYKAIPISGKRDYFETLSTYIHLNPVRAGMTDAVEGDLSRYAWSSYPLYLRSKRPSWLSAERVLKALGMSDTSSGRAQYRAYMKKKILEVLDPERARDFEQEWKHIRRGWYFGDEDLCSFLADRLNILPGKRDSFSGDEAKKHDEQEAERLLDEGLRFLGMTLKALRARKFSDIDKCMLAWLIRRNTSVSNGWISTRLRMGRVDCFSRYPRRIEMTKDKKLKRRREDLVKSTRIRD